ncbi:MAG: cation:proton antiporter [Bryobacterales bacterium]|nr:cation:proton antiporter [Bryobacterales bacterium]
MHEGRLLLDLTLLVGMAIPIVALAHRLSAPPLVGFLVAGVLVGPNGFGLISATEEVEVLSELGVALLLFEVGLELSLSYVRQWARTVLVGGGLQMGGTLLCVAALAISLGISPGQSIFYGLLAAMSSTAIVSKTYADRAELDSAQGRSVISILLFQDLCVLPLILLLPVLAGLEGADMGAVGTDFARGLVIITALVVGGQFIVRRTLDRIVLFRDPELFTLCVGFFGIGTAVVSAWAGFSLAIGAFIAGLVISESEYGLQALSDVRPFRVVFSGIFFISTGMLLDVPFLVDQLDVLVPVLLVMVALKAVLVTVSVRAAGGILTTALISGLSLAQIGEFSILLAALGLPLGLFREGDYQLFLSTAVLSMMATPFLIRSAGSIAARIAPSDGGSQGPASTDADRGDELSDHTIIVGYGVAGRYLARVLDAAGIPCIVVEHDPNLVRRAREDGLPVRFGNGTQPAVLKHVGVRHARIIVFAISSPTEERRGVHVARDLNATAQIIVRTRYTSSIDELMSLGATDVVVEEFEVSIELFAKALESYRIPINRIWQEASTVRNEHYGLFRGTAAPDLRLDALKHLGIHDALELVEIRDGANVTGMSATSLRLRRRTGAVQIAVVRDGEPLYRREPDFHYRAGDTVVLVGDRDSLDRAIAVFQEQRES